MAARIIIPALLLCLGGCVDHPSALRLTVELQEQSINTNEPLQLRATLTAAGGRVAIGKRTHVSIEVRDADDESLGNSGRIVECGMQRLALWPFYLLATPIRAVDAADVCGRYTLLEQDEQETFHLEITPSKHGHLLASDRNLDKNGYPSEMKRPWPPGEYKLITTLQCVSPRPTPIFWKPYNHPITVEVEFTVTADTNTAKPLAISDR